MAEEQTGSQTEGQDAAASSTTSEATEPKGTPESGQTTGEQQATASESRDTAQQGGDSTDAPQGAPDSYEFSPPEGYELDGGVLDTYSEVAKELNLTQEAAQKLVDKLVPAMADRHDAQVQENQERWAEEARNDKELGGDKFDENLGRAKAAVERFGSQALVQLLNETGLGNHPEVIRAFHKIGLAIKEDGFVGGDKGEGWKPPQSEAEMADIIYGTQS